MTACRLSPLLPCLLVGMMACGVSTPSATASLARIPDCRGSTEIDYGAPSPGSDVSYPTLTVDQKLRDYRLFRPPTLATKKPIPLVVVLHGSPIDAAGFESYIKFDAEATAAGFLEASPNGCGGYWPYADGVGPITPDEDFIRKMVDQLETQFPIDRSRVFTVGASAGTWVAYRLACDMSDRFAAIASVAGTMRLSDPCQPARPASILEMHGTLDDQHPWAGGGPHKAFPVDSVMQRWAMLDGCTGDPTTTQTGITVTSVWSRCQGGAVVRLDKVLGGMHTWFGSTTLAPVPGEPDANTAIWSFFSSLQPRS